MKNIDALKEEVKKTIGRDPFADHRSWDLINKRLPKEYWPEFLERDGATKFTDILHKVFKPENMITDIEAHECWERIGNYYKNQGRYHEAIPVYFALYDQFLVAQEKTGTYMHKGMPLVWIRDCYSALGFTVIGKRYLMLTLCEDAIRDSGRIPPNTTGTYFRMVWGCGLPDSELKNYAKKSYDLWRKNKDDAMFPEWIVQQFDKNWLTEIPAPNEAGVFVINKRYVQKLMSKLGEKSGKVLENLADYILSCMPGCRTALRQQTFSTDLDIVCSMEGFEVDFRSELGRYFVCECKDWKKSANFSTVAKFCRVLDSVKAKFGILFSTNGISGKGKNKDAELERLKIFQDRGMVIVVVDKADLKKVAEGDNFINLLRAKYERVRLDLANTQLKSS